MYVNENGYNNNPGYWKGRVAEMVNWAGQLGIYALIDWHTLTPGDPNDGSYNNKWDFWGFMSSKHMSSTKFAMNPTECSGGRSRTTLDP